MNRKILALALLLSSGTVSAQTLVAHWDFNGTANDVSGNGHNGVIVGTGFSYVPGRAGVGAALRLTNPLTQTGTGTYVSVPSHSALDLRRWSIVATVRIDRWNEGPCQAQQILGRGTAGGSAHYCMQINDNELNSLNGVTPVCDNLVRTHETLGGGAVGTVGSSITPSTNASALDSNRWYCLTVTFDGSVVRNYVEGTLVSAVNWSGTYTYPLNASLSIGSYLAGQGGNFPYWLNGAIDDIKLYDNALPVNRVTCTTRSNDTLSLPWLTTANVITDGNNLFGTITNDDVILRTSSQTRGIFTKAGSFGFGTTTPNNRVEVSSAAANTSGLRLTNLTSSSPATPGNGKVLSVNTSGDVVLVPGGGATSANEGLTVNGSDVQLGYPCNGTATGFFSGNRVIPMNNKNLMFSTSDDGKLFMGAMGACPTNLQSRLEISAAGLAAGPINSYSTTRPSPSGLRFRDMTAATPFITNLTGGVLSLDSNGDVIWVGASGGSAGAANNGLSFNAGAVQLGRDCSAPSGGDLLSNRLVPMNDHNLVFSDGGLSGGQNRIGLGINGCQPGAKLDVVRNNENADFDQFNTAISGANHDFSSQNAIGVKGLTDNPMNNYNAGGYFEGLNASGNVHGVRGFGMTHKGGLSAGGWFEACGSGINYGVYAEACNSHRDGRGPSYAGFFNGDVFTTGYYAPSDQRLKQNIKPVTNALDILSRINPKTYTFNTEAYPDLKLPGGTSYGVMSQELETVLPTLVKETAIPDGNTGVTEGRIKAVNYMELIPILIQAVKDQQKQIEELSAKLSASQQKAGSPTGMDVEIGLNDAASLEQNAPNPYTEATVVGYYLPVKVKSAVMQFATVDGKVLKTIEIPTRGKGSVKVHTPELLPGTYVYTLLADGKVVDTKRMQILK